MNLTYWKNPATGMVEGIDEQGVVRSVQKNTDKTLNVSTKEGFTLQTTKDGRQLWVEDGLEDVRASGWTYTPALGGAIASLIAGGARITTLQKKHPEMPPYQVLARWMANNQEFREMIDRATKDRAVVLAESAVEVADEVYDKLKTDDDQMVAAAKLKIDAARNMAAFDAPDKYSSKSKGSGETNVQIVIDTGIRREPIDVTPQAVQIEVKSGN